MKLPEPLENLKNIKHAKIIGVVMTLVIGLALLLIAVSIGAEISYFILMVGLVIIVFLVPYLFGWRDGKMLAVLGIGVFLLLGAINGPLVVHKAFTTPRPEPVSSAIYYDWHTKVYTDLDDGYYETPKAWYGLTNGTLDIYKGEVGLVYRFNVTLISNDTFITAPDVRLGYARGIWGVEGTPTMTEADPTDSNYLDGKEFQCQVTISKPGIHSHWFALVLNVDGNIASVNTSVALGPLVGSETDNWGTYIPVGAASMFCNIGLLFLIVVLLYWWIGTAKEKRATWDKALREKEESAMRDVSLEDKKDVDAKPFTCDKCGAGVDADDNFCPKCGERFDGIVEEETEKQVPAK